MAKILVCDDDPDILNLFAARLRRSGHDVTTATDGEMALKLGVEQCPDVVVIDWMMPGMTGPEVCAALRADPRTRESRVLMLMVTARSQESDLKLAYEAGVDDFLVKPVRGNELQERVEKLLARS